MFSSNALVCGLDGVCLLTSLELYDHSMSVIIVLYAG